MFEQNDPNAPGSPGTPLEIDSSQGPPSGVVGAWKRSDSVFSQVPRRYGETFEPPHCPRRKCSQHLQGTPQGKDLPEWVWRRSGIYTTKVHPGGIQRYLCMTCERTFSRRAFDLEYWEKRPGLNAKIFHGKNENASDRGVGRQLECTEHLVRGRVRKMAQQGLLSHTALAGQVPIQEPVAYDGLENFAGSQYDPNHLNQAIGTETLFCYDFNFAPLNRKGRMSERQKRIKSEIEEQKGAYPKRAIRKATVAIFKRLRARVPRERKLQLVADRHFQYTRAIERDLKWGADDVHLTRISSKEARTFQNVLFPVNHADLLVRHRIAPFRRETIAFRKTHSRMVDQFVLFILDKNYCRPQFVKPHVRRPQAHTHSPAMQLGVATHRLSFRELYDWRRTPERVPLHEDWKMFYEGKVPYPRKKIRPIMP